MSRSQIKNKVGVLNLDYLHKKYTDMPVTTENLQSLLSGSSDIIFEYLAFGRDNQIGATLIFAEGLTDSEKISESVIRPLNLNPDVRACTSQQQLLEMIQIGKVYAPSSVHAANMDELLILLFTGTCVLILDDLQVGICFTAGGYNARSMSASGEENSYKSAKDCFVEPLRANTATLRLKIKSPDLVNEEIFTGRQSKTRISICYMRGICNDTYIEEVRRRVIAIDCDAFLSLDDILPYLCEKKHTIFPQSYTTEKPVLYAAALLEGRIGVMVDGIPYGIILPATFQDFFQSSYDYATDFISATLFRFSRYALALIAFLLPGFYAAITTFHQEVLPYSLAYTIITSKQRTPFPIAAELIIMSIAFYTLIEAAMRTPSSITPTVSIVGGLILGEAAISSNLISPGVIVAVAMAAVASLTVSNRELSNALWLCQIFNTVLCSLWGLFGAAICILLVLHHLCSLENLGLPYFSPFTGGQKRSYKDSVIKFPSYAMIYRPAQFHPKNKRRRK